MSSRSPLLASSRRHRATIDDTAPALVLPNRRAMDLRLLDTVRQFAEEKLEQSGEQEALRGNRARWYVDLVESLEPVGFETLSV